jgi:1-hydroxycarotenoid 3,4-desaturase
VAVIGAGIAGLCAAAELRAAGCAVVLLERAPAPGGKLRTTPCPGHATAADAGPTVLTLRAVFEQVFCALDARLEEHLQLQPLTVLARHAWCDGARLDLHAEVEQSAAAIAALAGRAEAAGYRRFCRDSQRVYAALAHSFIGRAQPSLPALIAAAGLRGLPDLLRLRPFSTLWQTLGEYFRDPRLRQLFGRYATYCGSSPFAAPATLMLVAHVEQTGVWRIDGGMHRLAARLAALLRARAVEVRYATSVLQVERTGRGVTAVQTAAGERLAVDAVVATCDAAAVATGLLGRSVRYAAQAPSLARRSLSAMTWVGAAVADGFELQHHNVFFADDYRREFEALVRRRHVPDRPTVYVCAQDRVAGPAPSIGTSERLLCLINAPAIGDCHDFDEPEIGACLSAMQTTLARCGLRLQGHTSLTCTTPTDFHRLFPASGGALYGPATHGWRASFRRPGPRTRIRGLYLAGGSVHPGPGLPMAALSGRHAAQCLLRDLASMRR